MTEPFHPHVTNVLGIITLAIWLHLFFGRGWFWRVRKLDADRAEAEKLSVWPTVVAIVPARNEAETIGPVVTGLVQQDYPGTFSVVVVDDHSEDATAQIAQQAAAENGALERVQVVSASDAAGRLDREIVGVERRGVECGRNGGGGVERRTGRAPQRKCPSFIGLQTRT